MTSQKYGPERATWKAMLKYADDQPLTKAEWTALSELTLIDRTRLEFAPGNVRWATSAVERADNLRFYQSFGRGPRR